MVELLCLRLKGGPAAAENTADRKNPQRMLTIFGLGYKLGRPGSSLEEQVIRICAVALGLLMLTGSSFAHHGTAAYHEDEQITVTGAVTAFDFTNPHALIYLDVRQSDGTIVKWQGQLTSPNHLVRAGWTRNSLQPGEQITISGHPVKKGANSMWIRKIVKANGTELPLVME